MTFDFPTMVVGLSFVVLLMGLMGFCSWLLKRRSSHLPPMIAACLFGSAGTLVSLLRPLIRPPISISAGNALVLLAYGLVWKACRTFEHRELRLSILVVPPALWVLACLYHPFYASDAARVVAMSAFVGGFSALVVAELWRGRQERLQSRWIVMGVNTVSALVWLLRIVFVRDLPFPLGAGPLNTRAAVLIPFEGIAYAMLTVFSVLLMGQERAELQQRRAANLDPLTGVANRRAFGDAADRICAAASPDERQVAILIFDLDRFKRINDTFGHTAGDDVLILFARTASQILGPEAVLARLGGEEFASAFHCLGAEQARRVAEEVRIRFAEAALWVNGLPIEGTVSVGGSIVDGRSTLRIALAAADQALYRAKQGGRNRVEFHQQPQVAPTP